VSHECNDKHFEQMLSAYELGMLSDDDREAFELHLYSCESCFERVNKFRSAARVLRDSEAVRETVASIAEQDEKVSSSAETTGHRSAWGWSRLVPTLAAAAVLLLLVFQPWRLEFRSDQVAVAVENRLAIMYFDNIVEPTDSTRLGEIITNLLITDLSESHYLQVVSSQRLHDALRLLGREDTRVLDRESATEVATDVGAGYMMMGSVLQVEPKLVVTAQLVDVATGSIIASQRVTEREGETVFNVVDRLTVAVKEDLGLPLAAQEEPDRMVADVTTHSPEAYRNYMIGVEKYNQIYFAEAEDAFHKALEYDSTFAMVYYYLAAMSGKKSLEKAVQHSDRATWKERLYIAALAARYDGNRDSANALLQQIIKRYPDEKMAFYHLGQYAFTDRDYAPARDYFLDALAIDPLFKNSYNMLAYTYNSLGDLENAIWALDKYIEVAPDEANPYDSKGQIYALHGKLHEAIASYQQALRIKPDFVNSLMQLGSLYIFARDYTGADSCFRAMALSETPNQRTVARLRLAYIPLRQGKFESGVELVDSMMRVERQVYGEEKHVSFRLTKAQMLAGLGRYSEAEAEIRLAVARYAEIAPRHRWYGRPMLALVLAEKGEIVAAQEVASEIKVLLDSAGMSLGQYWLAEGAVALAENDFDTAGVLLLKAMDDGGEYCQPSYALFSEAALYSGRSDEAIDRLTSLINSFGDCRLSHGLWDVQLHYWLGRNYEQLNNPVAAQRQYETFLAIWSEGDPGLPHVDDARSRLARLKSRP